MLKKIKQALFFKSCIEDKNGNIHQQIMEDNRKASIVWSIIFGAYFIINWLLTYYVNDGDRCRELYLGTAVAFLCLLVLTILFASKSYILRQLIIYVIQGLLMFAAIATALAMPEMRTVTYVAAVLIVPIMFVNDLMPVIVMDAVCYIIYMVFGKTAGDAGVYQWMVMEFALYASAGILIGYFINKTRIERYVFADSAVELAELQTRYAYYDQMTGLKNRRAYSEQMNQYKKELPAQMCMIMVDVNGLKQINDTLGHEAGDEIIIGSAKSILESFDGLDTIYRFGGDEFSIFFPGTEAEAKERLKRLEEISSGWKGKYIDGISLSYGMAFSDSHTDADALAKEADDRMYEFKANYYKRIGKDRRKQ